jgi:hypothetical protein
MDIDSLMNEERATRFLAEKLGQGTVTLFLGAGTSRGASLPDWPELLRRMGCDVAAGSSADVLQGLADDVKRDKCGGSEREFARLVKQQLYDGVSLSADLLRTDLLIALGAMLMGSRRGSVKRVMTFNFDSTLEWYVTLYGFIPRVILQPPELEGAEDVRIYHPHGFLAHPALGWRDSDFVILGLRSVNARLGTIGDPWWELMRHTLRTSVGLFVGLSFRSFQDRSIAPLLETVGKEVHNQRPTGVWLCPLESEEFSGPDKDKEKDRQTRAFLDSNVVPVFLPRFDDLPRFLLGICQEAAKAIRV